MSFQVWMWFVLHFGVCCSVSLFVVVDSRLCLFSCFSFTFTSLKHCLNGLKIYEKKYGQQIMRINNGFGKFKHLSKIEQLNFVVTFIKIKVTCVWNRWNTNGMCPCTCQSCNICCQSKFECKTESFSLPSNFKLGTRDPHSILRLFFDLKLQWTF